MIKNETIIRVIIGVIIGIIPYWGWGATLINLSWWLFGIPMIALVMYIDVKIQENGRKNNKENI